MRVLGVDYGFARIGLAVGESEPKIASPRPALAAAGSLKKDAAALHSVAQRERVDLVVVGIPVQDEEGDGRMARICRTVAENLRELGLTVETVDEAMTSVEADANLREMGLKASERRRHRDGEAACRILDRWFHGG